MTEQNSNPAQIIDWLNRQPSQRVKVGVTDLDGILRAKYLHRDKILSALADGFGFCNVIFGWDSQDTLYGNWTEDPGFADAQASLVLESAREIPWEANGAFLLADFSSVTDGPAVACPRSLLKHVVAQAKELGFTARFGPEYEWFVYRETPASLAEKGFVNPVPLSPGMFGYSGLRTSQWAAYHHQLFEELAAFRVPLEGLHTETGPGVLEAALLHQEALEAADRAVLFKQGVKEISYRHSFMASFMAKPSATLPGCGGHLHQSLWRAGKNAFFDPEAADGMSSLFRHYLAGQLRILPELMPMLAPTVNSYKRYVAGSWAATHVNWGVENRTVALRVINGAAKQTRLETRIPGADANPYLAIAAALAAGLYGIIHQLELTDAPVQGSAYEQQRGAPLPQNLGAGVEAMQQSAAARELFGEAFVQHFLKSREWEWQQYQSAVTDWERSRYFELA